MVTVVGNPLLLPYPLKNAPGPRCSKCLYPPRCGSLRGTLFRSGRSGQKVDGLNRGATGPGCTAEAPRLRPLWLR